MKQKKNNRAIGLGSGLSSLLGAEAEKKSENFKMVPIESVCLINTESLLSGFNNLKL